MNVGRAWLMTDWSRNRAAIYRALKINPIEPSAAYAAHPFTILQTGGGEHTWIAGAVGVWPTFSPSDWSLDDISDVILWNPRTGIVRLLGDDGPSLIVPHHPGPRLTVYADGFAFFRAWADQRAATFTRIRSAAATHRTTHAEPADSGLPGALAIGDLIRMEWQSTGASVLVAGPGIDPKTLNRAIIRSARLPRVESLAA